MVLWSMGVEGNGRGALISMEACSSRSSGTPQPRGGETKHKHKRHSLSLSWMSVRQGSSAPHSSPSNPPSKYVSIRLYNVLKTVLGLSFLGLICRAGEEREKERKREREGEIHRERERERGRETKHKHKRHSLSLSWMSTRQGSSAPHSSPSNPPPLLCPSQSGASSQVFKCPLHDQQGPKLGAWPGQPADQRFCKGVAT